MNLTHFSTSQAYEALAFGSRKTNQALHLTAIQMIKTDKRKVLFLKEEYANGQGKYTYSDGASYEGEWKNGKRHGKGILTLSDGRSISGNGIWEEIKIKESLSLLTVLSLKENSIMMSLKVKEYAHGPMGMNMLGN